MPKLPTNMIRRSGRSGYWFRGVLDGKLRQRSLGTDYRKAKAALDQLRSLKTRERWVPESSDLTVRAVAVSWLESYIATSRNPQGQRLARTRIAKFLVPVLGEHIVARLTSDHLRKYRLELERQMLSPYTVSHVLSDARCLLLWCEERGYVTRSPFPRRLLPRIQERPPDRVSDEEANLLRRLPGLHGFVARLALGTGMRWGELCRAQAKDVERGFLVVHHTKSGKVRRVPLDAELLAEVRNLSTTLRHSLREITEQRRCSSPRV